MGELNFKLSFNLAHSSLFVHRLQCLLWNRVLFVSSILPSNTGVWNLFVLGSLAKECTVGSVCVGRVCFTHTQSVAAVCEQLAMFFIRLIEYKGLCFLGRVRNLQAEWVDSRLCVRCGDLL